ncbi:MAG: hypothetical protein V4631_04425 [Pseudomonadota bacterium]
MKKLSILMTLIMGLSLTSGAMAHPEHDEAPTPRFTLDMVNKKDGATIYVTSRGEKVPTIGATGKLLLVRGKAKQEVTLRSAGNNAMETSTPTKMIPGVRARATITFSDQNVVTEDFVVK